jgi:hypothetical protein
MPYLKGMPEQTPTEKKPQSQGKFLAKSDWPKSTRDSIKMILNLIINFFPF